MTYTLADMKAANRLGNIYPNVAYLLKVHKIFPKVSFPPWLHPVKIWHHIASKLCIYI